MVFVSFVVMILFRLSGRLYDEGSWRCRTSDTRIFARTINEARKIGAKANHLQKTPWTGTRKPLAKGKPPDRVVSKVSILLKNQDFRKL